jgi:hypothetical protein
MSSCQVCHVDISQRKKYCDSCKLEKRRKDCRYYKAQNREKISAYNHEWKMTHKSEVSDYNKQYEEKNKETLRPKKTAYHKARLTYDPVFKAAHTLRSRLNKFIKRDFRNKTTEDLLGCTYEDFVIWMEYRFTDGMTMQNHGSLWAIDHVIPCSRFDLSDPDELHKCFHWSNTQPMISTENSAKGNTTDLSEQREQLVQIEEFLEECGHLLSDKATTLTYDRFAYIN